MVTVFLVCGARPNFMKIAPLMRAIEGHNRFLSATPIKPVVVHTGQHYDYEMSQIFFEDLDLPKPDFHLGIGSGTHAEQTGNTLIELERLLLREEPDIVLVVGDVNSTLAGALAAVKLHIPVAHVEAGVRCHDWRMPEEINRLLTDAVSDYLFTASPDADDNLRKEGIAEKRIFTVGNVMVDSLLYNKEKAKRSQVTSRLGLSKGSYALLTLHRAGNVDERERLLSIVEALKEISARLPVVFPAHPRTQKKLREFNLLDRPPFTNRHLLLIEPLGYLDFLNLEMNSKMVITDSGGVQVETTALDIPCLTVLDSPVWVATHEHGTNILVGGDSRKLTEEAFKILNGGGKKGRCPALWDGKTAERIIRVLAGGS